MLVANIKKFLSLWSFLALFLSANLALELRAAETTAGGGDSRYAALSQAEKNAELIDAVKYNEVTEVQLLLAAGANVNAREQNGWTVLMRAVLDGHVRIVQLLLAAGANTAEQIQGDRTALMLAISDGNMEMVQLLLVAGAEVPAKYRLWAEDMIQAAMEALERRSKEFLAAAEAGDLAKIDALIDQPMRKEVMSQALLALVNSEADVSEADFERVLTKFLAHEADINYQALMEVVTEVEADAEAGAIESKGAEAEAVQPKEAAKKRRTALDFAILQNRPDRVKFLLSQGADPLKLSEDARAYLAIFTLSKVTEFELAQERAEIQQRAKAAGLSEEDIMSGINIAALLEAEVLKLANSKAFLEMAAGGTGGGGSGGGSGRR